MYGILRDAVQIKIMLTFWFLLLDPPRSIITIFSKILTSVLTSRGKKNSQKVPQIWSSFQKDKKKKLDNFFAGGGGGAP